MPFLVAGMVIALGVTMIVAGVSGSGSELFQAITGRAPSGKTQSAAAYGNLSFPVSGIVGDVLGDAANGTLPNLQGQDGVTTGSPGAFGMPGLIVPGIPGSTTPQLYSPPSTSGKTYTV